MPSGDMSIRGEKMTASLTGLPVGLWTRRTATVTPLPFFTSALTGSKVYSLGPANEGLEKLMAATNMAAPTVNFGFMTHSPHTSKVGVAPIEAHSQMSHARKL